jgi:hypothetical protein
MLSMPIRINDKDGWLSQLREQALAARDSDQLAIEWFLVPAGDGCISQTSEYQRNLAAMVAQLLPR